MFNQNKSGGKPTPHNAPSKTGQRSGPRRGNNPPPKKSKMLYLASMVFLPMFVAGCTNMPTAPSQITGSYTSGLEYEKYDCSLLAKELSALARRENQLVIAQEQRIKTSQTQAFWFGYGQGDGIEASELANVKGEKEAVRKAMSIKDCEASDG